MDNPFGVAILGYVPKIASVAILVLVDNPFGARTVRGMLKGEIRVAILVLVDNPFGVPMSTRIEMAMILSQSLF